MFIGAVASSNVIILILIDHYAFVPVSCIAIPNQNSQKVLFFITQFTTDVFPASNDGTSAFSFPICMFKETFTPCFEFL